MTFFFLLKVKKLGYRESTVHQRSFKSMQCTCQDVFSLHTFSCFWLATSSMHHLAFRSILQHMVNSLICIKIPWTVLQELRQWRVSNSAQSLRKKKLVIIICLKPEGKQSFITRPREDFSLPQRPAVHSICSLHSVNALCCSLGATLACPKGIMSQQGRS